MEYEAFMQETGSEKPKLNTLADIAAYFAKMDSKYQFFHAKLFCCVVPQPENFLSFLAGLQLSKAAFPNSHPAIIVVGKLGPLVPIQTYPILAFENDKLQLSFHVSELKLPDFNYLAMIAPAPKSEAGTSYQLPNESINFLRSLLSLAFGKLPFYAAVADFDFDASGTVSIPSGVIRRPLYGDFFNLLDIGTINDVMTRLALQQTEFRGRFQRACNFFDMAFDQQDETFRFSSYWIALEIIVGGTSDAIRSKLTKAYGKNNKSFADDHLLFKEIETIRHDLMHKGLFGTLTSYQERLLQLYFWDIVIHQIGLKSRGLAMMFVKSGMIEEERKWRESFPTHAR
ncbi:MAG: hypothetical protein ACLQLT_04960 [Methylovirgula sp.]